MPRGGIDYFLYESYRLNSSSSADNPHHYDYPNNRFNFAPKIMAEANRADGFRVLSIGYAEGLTDQMSQDTLVGLSTLGTDSLLEDIRVAERLAGFRHYLTDSSLTLVNSFVADHADRTDEEAPVWTSTYNDHDSYPSPPGEATPRPGVGELEAGPGMLTVRWDVALDYGRVGYAIYYQTTPFDFDADPTLTNATRVVARPRPTAAYAHGVGPGVFTNEATLVGLEPGTTYYVVVRAFDDAPTRNEDANQIVLSGVPDAEPPYLGRLRASNGADDVEYHVAYAGTATTRRVYVDRDRMWGTGYAVGGIGADLMLADGALYRYAGHGDDATWTPTGDDVTFTTARDGDVTGAAWRIDRAAIGLGVTHTDLVFEVERKGGVERSPIYEHVYTSRVATSPILGQYVENDGDRIYFHAEVADGYPIEHIFLDDDADPRTGYGFGGIGAGYLIEGGALFRYGGSGWTWEYVADVEHDRSDGSDRWSVARSAVGAAAGSPLFQVVFQVQDEDGASFAAPAHPHAFTR
jgi:hypothetical protein